MRDEDSPARSVTFWRRLLYGPSGLRALWRLAIFFGILSGVFRFGDVALRGFEIEEWAALWALVFLVIALSEEFFYRGYPQFTLSTGIGFWGAALVLSACFGFNHVNRATETWVGALNAGVGGLFFCLFLRRTGDLWMPIGFHTAFNWGETYLYGVPNSGQTVPGHLLNPVFSGPAWLTGGAVGPEGSWLCTLLFAVLWLTVALWLREVRYPGPAVVPRASS